MTDGERSLYRMVDIIYALKIIDKRAYATLVQSFLHIESIHGKKIYLYGRER